LPANKNCEIIERAMLMGGACIKAYRWSPKKG
jgi:hypothetical protein